MDSCAALPNILEVKDLAKYLAISHNTAYNLVRSKAIRSVKIGRTYRITKEAVLEFLQAKD